jgi:hypothetical protein
MDNGQRRQKRTVAVTAEVNSRTRKVEVRVHSRTELECRRDSRGKQEQEGTEEQQQDSRG